MAFYYYYLFIYFAEFRKFSAIILLSIFFSTILFSSLSRSLMTYTLDLFYSPTNP